MASETEPRHVVSTMHTLNTSLQRYHQPQGPDRLRDSIEEGIQQKTIANAANILLGHGKEHGSESRDLGQKYGCAGVPGNYTSDDSNYCRSLELRNSRTY